MKIASLIGVTTLLNVGVIALAEDSPGDGKHPSGDYEQARKAANTGNYKEAFRIWSSMAEDGNVRAQYSLGRMFARGDGVGRDFSKAFRLFLSAAEQGFPPAQFALAKMYGNGDGVEKNLDRSLDWNLIANRYGSFFVIQGLDVKREKQFREMMAQNEAKDLAIFAVSERNRGVLRACMNGMRRLSRTRPIRLDNVVREPKTLSEFRGTCKCIAARLIERNNQDISDLIDALESMPFEDKHPYRRSIEDAIVDCNRRIDKIEAVCGRIKSAEAGNDSVLVVFD
jgi:hypothetical protein